MGTRLPKAFRRDGGLLTDRRLLASAAIVVGAVLFVLALLAAPGDPIAGDSKTALAGEGLITTLEPGDAVVQTTTAEHDRLAAVDLTFGTYFGEARCTLRVEVRDDDGDPRSAEGRLLVADEVSCADVPDSSPVRIQFEPLERSAGLSYDVVVRRTDRGPGQGVAVWGAGALDDTPAAVVDGQPDARTVLLRLSYDPQPRWWDHLGTVVSRMGVYGPVWAAPGPFGAMLLVMIAGLAAVPWLVRRPRAFLVLVCLLALARGLLWSAVLPPLWGMDEPAHLSNVQHIAVEHRLPGQADDAVFSDQVHLAWEKMAHWSYSDDGARETVQEVGAASSAGGGGGPASTYAPPYYAGGAAFYSLGGDDFFSTVAAVRVWSVLLGVAAAVVLVLVGRRLFPTSPVAQTAFALAGILQPMAGHQFAIVNNDAWVILAGFASFLVALALAERGKAPWLSLGAGLLLGAAVLGKPFGVAVAVPLVVGWLIGKVRHRVRSVRVLVTEGALGAAGLLVTYGTWLVVARLLGIADPQVPYADGARSVWRFLYAQVGPEASALRRMWGDQLWGNFGWIHIPYGSPVTWALFGGGVLVAVGMTGWLVVAVRRYWPRRGPAAPGEAPEQPEPGRPAAEQPVETDIRLAVTAAMLLGIVVVLYAAAWVYYRSSGLNDLLSGRYGLLALPAILAAPPLLAQRFGGRRSAVVVAVVLAVAMLLLLLGGWNNTLHTFYG
ncbi:MAG: glycosyltransferase family 39 protein [Micrococcales bacterium]|nr:glycosyltransferase family 39 protein [Micrococcales bacterium]